MVHIYFSEISNELLLPVVYPALRKEELSTTKNESRRNEKTAVWNLLSYAVTDTFSRPLSDFSFTKSSSGKWQCNAFHFSLSHSGNAVAVVISDDPVGIDIEDLTTYTRNVESGRRRQDLMIKRSCTAEEQSLCADILSFLKLWTGKEAVFKTLDSSVFTPERICVKDHPVTAFLVNASDNYVLSVCSPAGFSEKQCILSVHPSSPGVSFRKK